MSDHPDEQFMREALRLARRGYGETSPNPMVGAVLVKRGKIIGRGWHRRVGLPHAEIEALSDAEMRGHSAKGTTLYVTLEPCCTHGRTPPCTDAIIAVGIKRVLAGTMDPNPKHAGEGLKILKRAGIEVECWSETPSSLDRKGNETRRSGLAARQQLAVECARLNESFNHWIVRRTPFVTVKAAMTLDGKIATASGESKWITGEEARARGMELRRGADAILVGVNTILADNPRLTVRDQRTKGHGNEKQLRRIVLDSMARTPLDAQVMCDDSAKFTTIVVGRSAPRNRVTALARRVTVLIAPTLKDSKLETRNPNPKIDLRWLLKRLGSENVTNLLVEGGGEVNASFLLSRLAQRVVFFYAPKILGGRDSRKAVAGKGAEKLADALQLREVEWKRLGADLMLTALVVDPSSR